MLSIFVSFISFALGFGAAYYLMYSFYVQLADTPDWKQDPPLVTKRQRQVMRFGSAILLVCSISLMFYSATLKRASNSERELIRQAMQNKAHNYADSTGLQWRHLGKDVTLTESRKIIRDLYNRQLLKTHANPAQMEQMAITLEACISTKAVQGEQSQRIIAPVVTGCINELGYIQSVKP